ncbi:MAG: RluA family pseudouridine synthase [Burkholderiaceae bacterium]|nr:RluA family pseudouridine synthase [Burkholderiaceae bacterium]
MRRIIAKPSGQAPAAERLLPATTGIDAADSAAPAAIEIEAKGGAGERLDRFVASRLADVSRTRLQRWIALGAVRCDDRVLPASTRLSGCETIVVEPQPREADGAFVPEPVPIDVVHEDEHLLVLCKPAGLVVHPAAGNWRGTLLNGLLFHRPALAGLPRAGIVHRLDRDTSGLLVVAKTERAMVSLAAQLADRSMGRRYFALADGRCPARGVIDAAIARDEASRVRMAVAPAGRGRTARTFYRVLARGRLAGRDASLLECRLDSGRTHQIRVHLRSIGHPLVGDALYGGPTAAGFARQALHAWQLRLRHPGDGRMAQWCAPMPPDMAGLCAAAGIDVEAVGRAAAGAFDEDAAT